MKGSPEDGTVSGPGEAGTILYRRANISCEALQTYTENMVFEE